MASHVSFRIASNEDTAALAALRWRLKAGDGAAPVGAAFDRFAEEFARFEREARAQGEIFHWIAEADGESVAAMSVVAVRKVVSPGQRSELGERRWGYLTNCYVAAEHRNAGLGSRLLGAIQAWAKDRRFEFLIVWPSERAFTFYERSGFARPGDLLVWTPEDGGDV